MLNPGTCRAVQAKDSAFLAICWCSVAHSCLPLCDPKYCSMPGSSALRHLPELTATGRGFIPAWATEILQTVWSCPSSPPHPL